MVVKVIGLIELKDPDAFEVYKNQVGATVEKFGGQIFSRGTVENTFWNELNIDPFTSFVELHFPNLSSAQNWASSAEYQNLLKVRHQALKVTLFSVQTLN